MTEENKKSVREKLIDIVKVQECIDGGPTYQKDYRIRSQHKRIMRVLNQAYQIFCEQNGEEYFPLISKLQEGDSKTD